MYYVFAAYTERAFLLSERLFKRPLKRALLEQDLMTAIPLSQVRFKECFHASQVLNSETYKNENSNKTRRRQFLQNMTLGFLSPTLLGYSKFECCYNPGAGCNAYTGEDDDNDDN